MWVDFWSKFMQPGPPAPSEQTFRLTPEIRLAAFFFSGARDGIRKWLRQALAQVAAI